MGNPHPVEIRERVVCFVEEGNSHRSAARRFRVSPKFVNDMVRLKREPGGLAAKRQGNPGRGKLADLADRVQARMTEKRDLTLDALAVELRDRHGVRVQRASVGRLLHRLGLGHKKVRRAAEQRRPDVAQARHIRVTRRRPFMRNSLERLVFIDETSLKTNMGKTTGRAPVGTRLLDYAPYGHWHTQTFIAPLRHDRLDAPWVLPGAITKESLERYIEIQLAPTLRAGDIVILDNLSSHNSSRAAEILRGVGAWFLFLPSCSPDLNPIEMAFSKLEALLRKAASRTYEDLWRTVGAACDLFSDEECYNFFKAAGYETG